MVYESIWFCFHFSKALEFSKVLVTPAPKGGSLFLFAEFPGKEAELFGRFICLVFKFI